MKQVVPRVFISGIEAACNDGERKRRNISHIISIGCHIIETESSEGRLEYQSENDHYQILQYPHIRDLPDSLISPIFEECNNFISDALASRSTSNVLVHCYYGQSRSATVLVAYLIGAYSPTLPLTEALQMLAIAKPDICINPGFLSQVVVKKLCLYQDRG